MLNHRIAIYVPSTINGNVSAPEIMGAWTDRVLVAMSKAFGGATVIDGMGAWVHESLGLVKEPVKIVYAYCDDAAFDDRADDMMALAQLLRSETGQEAVSIVFDDTMRLVFAPNKIKVAV